MARFRAFDDESDDEGNSSSSSSSHFVAADLRKKSTTTKSTTPPVSQKPKTRRTTISSVSSVESADDDSESGDDSDIIERELDRSYREEDSEMVLDGGEEEVTAWPEELDLEPHRVHVMQTSLFRMPELAKSMLTTSQLSRPLNGLKHPRDGLEKSLMKAQVPKDIPPRASFLQPRPHPPANKYLRITQANSLAAGQEGLYADAGLAFGRSFRAGWGPGGKLVHFGRICHPSNNLEESDLQSLHLTKVHLTETTVLPDLLSCLLSNTSIIPASEEHQWTPHIEANRSLTFATFECLFNTWDATHVVSLFRLGRALLDPLDISVADSVSQDVRRRVLDLRRADAFSSWLAKTVDHLVEQDLRTNSSADSAALAFIHLSGNQVEKAVDALTNGGNLRLATLVAQVPGDEDFKTDLQEQLMVWKSDKLDTLITPDMRKIYALLAGIVDVLEGSNPKEDIELLKGLDWRRTLGLLLWFESSLDTPLHETFERYENLYENSGGRISFPKPWYSSASSSDKPCNDAQFSLMKLVFSPSMTLESALNPLGFGPNPRDYKLPWFLYVLLSRCMRISDFSDRKGGDIAENMSDGDGGQQDGYSVTADALTTNFAAQLEQDGMIQEAAFVLLFLEGDIGRQHAIKDLLCRAAPLLDEWSIAGIEGSLKIPHEWIDEAQAGHELDRGNIFRAYELYLKAGIHRTAHELAILHLAPEAILREDLELLRSLFDVLDQNRVPDWTIGGQLFLDYATILTRVPELTKQHEEEDAIPDASELAELSTLTARIPKLIGVLPDVVREKPGSTSNAVLSTMLSNLLVCLTLASPTTKVEIPAGLVTESARIKYIEAAATASLMRSVEVGAWMMRSV